MSKTVYCAGLALTYSYREAQIPCVMSHSRGLFSSSVSTSTATHTGGPSSTSNTTRAEQSSLARAPLVDPASEPSSSRPLLSGPYCASPTVDPCGTSLNSTLAPASSTLANVLSISQATPSYDLPSNPAASMTLESESASSATSLALRSSESSGTAANRPISDAGDGPSSTAPGLAVSSAQAGSLAAGSSLTMAEHSHSASAGLSLLPGAQLQESLGVDGDLNGICPRNPDPVAHTNSSCDMPHPSNTAEFAHAADEDPTSSDMRIQHMGKAKKSKLFVPPAHITAR